jgi:hypothetical protein
MNATPYITRLMTGILDTVPAEWANDAGLTMLLQQTCFEKGQR